MIPLTGDESLILKAVVGGVRNICAFQSSVIWRSLLYPIAIKATCTRRGTEALRMYEPHKALGVADPLAFSYLPRLYRQGNELHQLMAGRIAYIEYFILSLCPFLCAAGVKIVEWLSFDRTVTFCEIRAPILRVAMPMPTEWF